MSESSKHPSPPPDLHWKWQIAQYLAKRNQRRAQQNPVAGYVMENHVPGLDTPKGITATLALTALTDALREQNAIQRQRERQLSDRYDQQRSLLEALVQFVLVFLLLIGVGGYAAVDWVVSQIGGRLDALLKLPGIDWLLPDAGDQRFDKGGYIPNSVAFDKLDIATPYLYDESPPGAWDFTLIDPKTDSTAVAIPSPCPGVIDDVGGTERAGNYLWLTCQDGTRWFMAHLHQHHVSINSTVRVGDSLGIQGTTGNSTGDHIHAVIDPVRGERSDRTATKPILDAAFDLWKKGNSRARDVSQQTVALVKRFEGLQLSAYPDGTAPNGQAKWSIGYGTPSRPGETITQAEAEQRLIAHLAVAARRVDELVQVPLSEHQRSALISFEYNTGGLAASKLLTALNQGQVAEASTEFNAWVYWLPHDGMQLEIAPGLVKRRQQERRLFLGQQIAQAS